MLSTAAPTPSHRPHISHPAGVADRITAVRGVISVAPAAGVTEVGDDLGVVDRIDRDTARTAGTTTARIAGSRNQPIWLANGPVNSRNTPGWPEIAPASTPAGSRLIDPSP